MLFLQKGLFIHSFMFLAWIYFLCKCVGPEFLINLKAYTLKSVPCMFFVFLIFCICLSNVYEVQIA